MEVIALKIPDVKLIVPQKFGDSRGFFSETYNQKRFCDVGITDTFVQDNHSLSAETGLLRGLHYQKPPYAQAKIIRVLKGRIFDVAVDIRKDSPTFGQWVSAELSAENWKQIYVPVGFAHGFVTLEPDTEVSYKMSDFYAPDHEAALLWNDPDLTIDWPVDPAQIKLNEKDRKAPTFKKMIDSLPF